MAQIQPEQFANISSILVQLLLPVVVAIGGMALNAFRRWLASNTQNTTIQGAMVILVDIVQTTVHDLEQTTVKSLRESNGTLDAAVAAKVKADAIAKIQALYGPDGIKDLSRRLGTSEDATLRYIGSLIEQAVYLLKNPPPPPPPALPEAFNPDVFPGMTASERIAAQTSSAARPTTP